MEPIAQAASDEPNPRVLINVNSPVTDQSASPAMMVGHEPVVISPTRPTLSDVPNESSVNGPDNAEATETQPDAPKASPRSNEEAPVESEAPASAPNTSEPQQAVSEVVPPAPFVSAQSSPTVSTPQFTEQAPIAPSIGMGGNSLSGAQFPVKKGRRKLVLFGGGVVLVLALTSGVVFGWYLPNTPNNVYNTGLSRSGKALNSLIIAATDKKKLETYKTSTISGSIDTTVAKSHYTGDFTTTFDKASLNGGLDVALTDAQGKKEALTAKVLSQIPSGSVYPNIWFQLTGLKTLGLDPLFPQVGTYDRKWIAVSSSYLQSIGAKYLNTSDNTQTQITTEDIAEVARAVSGVSQQYLFSTGTDKAVFEKRSFVGKEQVDGLSVYHYKVGVNIEHAKAYCVALSDATISTNAYKKVSGRTAAEITSDKTSAAKDCNQSTSDAIKATDTYDLWIDGHYKLVYKFRVYDKADKGLYTDVGQIYKGGDTLSLFVKVHDTHDSVDGAFTLDTDLNTNQTNGTLIVKSTSNDFPFNVTVKLKAVLSSKAVQVTPPTSAIKIEDVLKSLGLDATATPEQAATLPITKKADDSERQTDIRALQAFLEASYASNGFYPTLAQLNDQTWQKANLKGLDPAALAPPASTAKTLATKASVTQYAYVPENCDADGCASYTLSALLSDGSTFTKNSL